MIKTPSSERITVGLFGMINTGKSSLMNNLFEKNLSIVSKTPGTTTDPVIHNIELEGLGPVTVFDTAGFDDTGELGNLRKQKTFEKLELSQIAVFVTRCDTELTEDEKTFLDTCRRLQKEIIIALTFGDLKLYEKKISDLQEFKTVIIDNIQNTGTNELKKQLIGLKDKLEYEITPVEGLVNENDLVILVTPIDLAAPKARLILPQVETIRDLLDKDCAALILKERELKYFYDSLTIKPKLIITDSQAFSKVSADIPEEQPLTSFSILFARKKGDLAYFVNGIKHLENTPPNAKILILESCNHHRQADDIGTVKIPRLFKQIVKSDAIFEFAKELPEDEKLKEYFLVINCAGCMVTRAAMIKRINSLKKNNIYGTNYGLFLAWANGLLPRALEPFPLEYDLYKKK